MNAILQLVVVVLVLSQTSSMAQLYNGLHNFPATSRDGYSPSGLAIDGNTLYGTTASGGTNGNGTIFKINTDGAAYGILQSLTDSPGRGGNGDHR